jgi:hypothetical protein
MTEPIPLIPEDTQPAEPDFISLYLQYTAETECPTFFHRWCALSTLAAWIGRDIHFPFGHSKIHANMYVMLVGLAGTKKSTAIKIGTKLLKQAGYKTFAAKKTRQEKFLIDLAEMSGIVEGEVSSNGSAGHSEDNILDQNLFGDEGNTISADNLPPAEVFVAADEINNFIGTGNLDFMSILGELWDIDEAFDYKLKNSKSVVIAYPTINLLGGNTFVGFSKLFPPEATEQGFFSRMLFIYAEPKGREYTIPPEPNAELRDKLLVQLHLIKDKVQGKITITKDAFVLLDSIYMKWGGMDDVRFDSYENRRIIHLLKLAMLLMATKLRTEITRADILEANTILSFTEQLMPKALGEFGKARNSDVTHKIMMCIDATKEPLNLQDLWQVVHTDLENRNQLMEIIGNLQVAKKIQVVSPIGGKSGYLPIKKVREKGITGAVDWNLLTKSERDLI